MLQITPQPFGIQRRPHHKLQHSGTVFLDLGVRGE
jgi:hypothetical protein